MERRNLEARRIHNEVGNSYSTSSPPNVSGSNGSKKKLITIIIVLLMIVLCILFFRSFKDATDDHKTVESTVETVPETVPEAKTSTIEETDEVPGEVPVTETDLCTEENTVETEETTQDLAITISDFDVFVWNDTTGVQQIIEPDTDYQMHPDDHYFITCHGDDGTLAASIRLEDGSLIHPEENLDYVELSIDTTSSLQRVAIFVRHFDGSSKSYFYCLRSDSE